MRRFDALDELAQRLGSALANPYYGRGYPAYGYGYGAYPYYGYGYPTYGYGYGRIRSSGYAPPYYGYGYGTGTAGATERRLFCEGAIERSFTSINERG